MCALLFMYFSSLLSALKAEQLQVSPCPIAASDSDPALCLLPAVSHDLVAFVAQCNTVQWYPGHIAKAERQLKEQLKMVDLVLEVRDARIPVSTCHPQVRERPSSSSSIG
jgi:hypothetical protein